MALAMIGPMPGMLAKCRHGETRHWSGPRPAPCRRLAESSRDRRRVCRDLRHLGLDQKL